MDDQAQTGGQKCEMDVLGINMIDLTKGVLIYHQKVNAKHYASTLHNFQPVHVQT